MHCRCKRHQLQSLVGKLEWTAHVIRCARMHVSHHITLIKKLGKPNHHVYISATAHQDICFWADCIRHFNGTAYFIEDKPVPLQIFSTEVGASFYASDYFYTAREADFPLIQPCSTYVKGLLMLLFSAERWDNLGPVMCINSSKASGPDAVDCLQRLCRLSVLYNCEFKAIHMSSKPNFLADALNRAHTPLSNRNLQCC